MRSEPVLIICVVLFVLRLNNEWVRSCMRKYYELSVYDYTVRLLIFTIIQAIILSLVLLLLLASRVVCIL